MSNSVLHLAFPLTRPCSCNSQDVTGLPNSNFQPKNCLMTLPAFPFIDSFRFQVSFFLRENLNLADLPIDDDEVQICPQLENFTKKPSSTKENKLSVIFHQQSDVMKSIFFQMALMTSTSPEAQNVKILTKKRFEEKPMSVHGMPTMNFQNLTLIHFVYPRVWILPLFLY